LIAGRPLRSFVFASAFIATVALIGEAERPFARDAPLSMASLL